VGAVIVERSLSEKLEHVAGKLADGGMDAEAASLTLATVVPEAKRLERRVERLEGRDDRDPLMPLIRHVFDYWQQACGHPRALMTSTEGRKAVKAVRGCLAGVKAEQRPAMVERLMQAIDYAAAFPYVVDAQRRATGPVNCRHDGLDLICRRIDTWADRAAATKRDEGGLERKLVGA
jgi:hypothetical protein